MQQSGFKLPPEQAAAVNNARRILATVLPDLQKLQACGKECTEEWRQYHELNNGLSAIAQHFGVPG
jgi:hypothetical protein